MDNERITIKYLTVISKLSVDEIDAEFEKGYQDMLPGKTILLKRCLLI